MLFGLDRENSTLFQLCLIVWIRNCWRQFLELEASFQKVFFSRWWIFYVQLFSNVIFALAQDFTSNVELRSKDYNHFCYKLREVRHLEKDFGFEAVWDLRTVSWHGFELNWLVQQMTDSTGIALFGVSAKMHHFQYVTFLSCWTCAHLFSNMGCEFRPVGQFCRQN